MERRISTHKINKVTQRFSGHKKDDGHLAADTKSNDFQPLIRIVDTAARSTSSCEPEKVLYLKQDTHDKPFLTTHFDTPRQHTAERKSSLRPSQHLDATVRVIERTKYWMDKLPNNHRVQTAGAELIDLCAGVGTAEFGLACTTSLRDRLQNLHDAIHAPEPPADAVVSKDSPRKSGVFGSLRRSITSNPGSGTSSPTDRRSRSPEKRPGPQPRQVSFAYEADERFIPVSPRKPPATPGTPGTPRLGHERTVAQSAPDDSLPPVTQPSGRPLPPLPTHALDKHTPDAGSPSPKSPKSPRPELTAFERNRRHPQTRLTPHTSTSQPNPQHTTPVPTPVITPRDEDN